MKILTNQTAIPLSLAVWLAHESYEHDPDDRVISATTLLKPLRAIVLGRQHKDLDQTGDIVTLVASSSGTAYHDAVREVWQNGHYREAMKKLGYPESVIERIVVNPKEDQVLPENAIVVWTEIRTKKEANGMIVSGELDFCADGDLEDHKSTSVYAWIFQSNAEAYMLQGSIYRWLNPDKVTGDKIKINYIFTDWSASAARQDKEYPQKRIMSKGYELMSIPETDSWIRNKIGQIQAYMDKSQDELPLCTKDELWQSDSVWKYYKNPDNRSRSTKNFDNPVDAETRRQADGAVGVVIEVPGQVKRCQYCNVAGICDQAKNLVSAGLLVI